jgi:hypothetical protein
MMLSLSNLFRTGSILLLSGILASCNLEKDVTINLPPYEQQLVVEAYIEKDKPHKLLLTETNSYFDSIQVPMVNNALVTITYNELTDTLKNEMAYDLFFSKVFNYKSAGNISPAHREGEGGYKLQIQDSLGRQISATAKELSKVSIDTIEWRFREDSLAYLLVKFTDNPDEQNFYRMIINKSKVSSEADTDRLFSDRYLNGQQIPMGTSYRFSYGDTLYVRLYHIDQKYHDYLQSIEDASNANGNPFAQPATIKSGVEGGIGIFTVLSYDQKQIILK